MEQQRLLLDDGDPPAQQTTWLTWAMSWPSMLVFGDHRRRHAERWIKR